MSALVNVSVKTTLAFDSARNKEYDVGESFRLWVGAKNAIVCNTLETEGEKSQQRPLNLRKPYFPKRNKRKSVVSDRPRGKKWSFFICVLSTLVDYNTQCISYDVIYKKKKYVSPISSSVRPRTAIVFVILFLIIFPDIISFTMRF